MNGRRRVAVAVALLAVPGCGGAAERNPEGGRSATPLPTLTEGESLPGRPPQASVASADVVLRDFEIGVRRELSAGKPITVVNRGGRTHNLTVAGATIDLRAGDRGSVVLLAAVRTRERAFCRLHRRRGMQTTVAFGG